MRKNFVFFVLIPLIIILVVVYFFIDGWIEAGLEYAGESAVGAKVEIDNLSVTLSPVGLKFSRLQVADPNDPWKNIVETGKIQFAMDFGQLLRGKYIIDKAELNDVTLGTKRTTDGSLPGGRRTEPQASSGSSIKFADLAEAALQNHIIEHPLLDPSLYKSGLNIDSLLKVVNLHSVTFIETLKVQATAVTAQWPAAMNDIETSKKRIAIIDSSVRAINPSGLKDVASITSAIATVDQATKGIKDVVNTFDARQTSIKNDISRISGSAARIDDVVKEDYSKVLSLAKLPDLNTMGLAQALLGKEMIANVKKYLTYVDIARAKMAEYQPEPKMEKPPRMRGQDIHFPTERAYPKFWLKSALISGGTDRTQDTSYIYAKGEVKNISSDQRVTNLPLTASLSGNQGRSLAASLSAMIDRRKQTPLDQYNAQVSGLKIGEMALGSTSFLNAKMTGAQLGTALTVTIPGDRFEGVADLQFRGVAFRYAGEAANTGERLVREVLNGVTGFDLKLRGWKTDTGFDVALHTDLDEQFTSRVKAVLGAELAKLQADVRARINAVVDKKRKEFESLYAAKKAQVEQQLAQYQSLVTEKASVVDQKKKELEDRLEKVKKGALDDAVKRIFKK
jgi:uncharacterized protein (TIGR03545 family)